MYLVSTNFHFRHSTWSSKNEAEKQKAILRNTGHAGVVIDHFPNSDCMNGEYFV